VIGNLNSAYGPGRDRHGQGCTILSASLAGDQRFAYICHSLRADFGSCWVAPQVLYFRLESQPKKEKQVMKTLSIVTILTAVTIVALLNSGCGVANGQQPSTSYVPVQVGQDYTFYFNGGGSVTATMAVLLSDYWVQVYEPTHISNVYYINMQNVTYTLNLI
jgi:hypothetical protein